LSAQTGISGSVDVGADVVMGGQVGVADHISIASGTMIAAQAGISGTIKNRGIYAGSPHQDIGSWRKSYVLLRNLEGFVERIKELEKRLEELINER
jgi:UDP-3-O-[3-hydroxymyristoyl] glucosamine N-acyltransferase